MPDTIPDRLLRWVFTVLALIALAGLIHTSLLRKTPLPFEIDLDGFSLPGYSLKLRKTALELPGDERSFGRLRSWSAESEDATQPPFHLHVVAVHIKTEDDADFSAMAAHPALPPLEDRRSQDSESGELKPSSISFGESADEKMLQSCIVPGAGSYAKREQLLGMIRKQRSEDWSRKLRQIIGLEDNIRWECLLVSISMPKEHASDEALLDAWNSVYPALSTSLQESRR